MPGKAGKFDGLQAKTDPLFEVPKQRQVTSGETPKRQRPATSGTCDERHNRIGLFVSGDHLIWRAHTYKTWSGATLPCRTSSVRLCDSPARLPFGDPAGSVPACTCADRRGTCADGHRTQVLAVEGHFVWAEHTFATWGAELRVCSISGARLCERPAAQSEHGVVPVCPCGHLPTVVVDTTDPKAVVSYTTTQGQPVETGRTTREHAMSTTETVEEVQQADHAPFGPPSLEEMRETVAGLSMYLHDFYKVDFFTPPDYNDSNTGTLVELGPSANLISSRIRNGENDGKHTLMVDIDGPVAVTRRSEAGDSVVVLGMTADPFGFRTVAHLNAASALLVSTGIASTAGHLTLPGSKAETLAFCTDHPVYVVKTTTRGHHHLYIDAVLTLEQLVAVLHALALLNIVESGYARVTEKRQAAHLRLPWIRKDVTR